MIPVDLPNGYVCGKPLRSGPSSRVFAAVREADGLPVVLKVYAPSRTHDSAELARGELDMLRGVAGPGVPVGLELHLDLERPVLVVEQCRGRSLFEWVRQDHPTVAATLEVGIQLASILERIHGVHMLHRDVRPTNVMVEPRSREVHLVDFGLARRLGAAARSAREVSGPIEGSLHYMSPEQTGRMSRGCDARSDLYSLGATLYFAATGEAPFEIDDPLELVHAHLARRARDPREIRPELPRAFARVLLRLLEKEPDDRYQSATSLRADLEQILHLLTNAGSELAQFVPDAADSPSKVRFTGKLFGREAELARLHSAYDRAAEGQLVLVALGGTSGAGKSSLVHQLRAEVARTHGHLVSSKLDQTRDRPYAAWQGALSSLVQQLLVASDAILESWKRKLSGALGALAGAIQELAPDLSFVLDDIVKLPPLGPAEARARLGLALARFLGATATREHPLVVFLDDVQWCDAGSLHLLEELMLRGDSIALLLVAGYRADEVDAQHPLRMMFSRLSKRDDPPIQIELGPLSHEATTSMLASALEREAESVVDLARWVERKTGNNPLLIREFIDTLCATGILRYERGAGWIGDLDAVRAAAIPDGAVALLTPRIDALAPDTRALLTLASCVGDEVDTHTLSEMSETSSAEVDDHLFALNDAGLIVPSNTGFRFAHDRIREAVQSQLDAQGRAAVHLAVARVLLRHTHPNDTRSRILEVADHVRAAACGGIPAELRAACVQALATAGTQALASGVAETAERYLASARELFDDTDVSCHAQTGFEIWLQSAEAAYQLQDLDACDRHLSVLEARDLALLESTFVACKRARLLTFTRGQKACVRFSLERLRELGVSLPFRPSKLRAQWALLRADRALERAERRSRGEFPPPQQSDPRCLAALLLLSTCSGALARIDVHLAILGLTSAIRLQIDHGFVTSPAFAISVHATYLQVFLGRARRAEHLARVALDVTARRPDPQRAGRTEMVVHVLLRPFLESRHEVLASLTQICRMSEECGDLEYAFYARRLGRLYQALGGSPVSMLQSQMEADVISAELSGTIRRDVVGVEHAYSQLSLERIDPTHLESELRASEERGAGADDGDVVPRTMWMMVLSIYGLFDRVLEISTEVGNRLWTTSPFVHVVDFSFYRALAAAQVASTARGLARQRLLRVLRHSRRVVDRHARNGPDFVHMNTLLQAEHARLRGRLDRAVLLYERAAREATQQQFVHHAALALERAARVLLSARRVTDAEAHLIKSIERYRDWGARGKVASLEEALTTLRTT